VDTECLHDSRVCSDSNMRHKGQDLPFAKHLSFSSRAVSGPANAHHASCRSNFAPCAVRYTIYLSTDDAHVVYHLSIFVCLWRKQNNLVKHCSIRMFLRAHDPSEVSRRRRLSTLKSMSPQSRMTVAKPTNCVPVAMDMPSQLMNPSM
jgi:hypothetical protein